MNPMNFNSQRDKKWAKDQLGTCKDTIGQSGCKITTETNLARVLGTRDTTPDKLNKWCTQNHGYVSGCMLVAPKSAEYLGLKYLGRFASATGIKERYVEAETDHYKKMGVPQHFFLLDLKTGLRADPLDLVPTWETNNYRIVSYRVYEPLPNAPEIVVPETPVVIPPAVEKPAEVIVPPVVETAGEVVGPTTPWPVPINDQLKSIGKGILNLTRFVWFIK